MKHARISGYLLLVTGFLHTLIGLVDGYPQLTEMARAGLVNSATTSPEREAIFWFLVCGVVLFLTGLLALGYDRPLPASFGWGLLALSIVGTLLLGPSGFLLVIPQALYVLVIAYRSARNRQRGMA
jgi:predicted benzoate:H+ symporter BenE